MMRRNPLMTLITEDDDDAVVCPMRIGFWCAFLTLIGLAAFAVIVRGQPFDPAAYGLGIGGLLTGAGAAIFFNAKAPSDPPKPKGEP